MAKLIKTKVVRLGNQMINKCYFSNGVIYYYPIGNLNIANINSVINKSNSKNN